MPIGFVQFRRASKVGRVKTAAAAPTLPTLSTLTPGEIKGIGAALGIGTLLAILRSAAKMNEAELHEEVGALNAARADRAVSEVNRARSLADARRRSEDHMRVAVGRSGLNVMHPGIDPASPAFIVEAARRRGISGAGSWGRDNDFFKGADQVKGFVGF